MRRLCTPLPALLQTCCWQTACYVQVLVDEYFKSFKRVRQRPADFELDDALDEPGEGEDLRLTAMPAQQQGQLSRLSISGDGAATALPGKSVPLAEVQQTQKGRFNASIWEQDEPL